MLCHQSFVGIVFVDLIKTLDNIRELLDPEDRLRTKQSTDLHISRLPGWEDVDKEFFNNLQPRLKSYTEEFDNSFRLGSVNDWLSDTGYQIQRTEPGGFYDWHSDFSTSLDENSVTGVKSRYYTYIWYLNTIEECGWTEFRSGVKIKPEEGKLLILVS